MYSPSRSPLPPPSSLYFLFDLKLATYLSNLVCMYTCMHIHTIKKSLTGVSAMALLNIFYGSLYYLLFVYCNIKILLNPYLNLEGALILI